MAYLPPNYTCFKCKMVGDHWITKCPTKKLQLSKSVYVNNTAPNPSKIHILPNVASIDLNCQLKQQNHHTTKQQKYHHFDGNEKFKASDDFKLSHYNQTIKNIHHHQHYHQNECKFIYCNGLRNLDHIKNKSDRCYYFEIQIDTKPTASTFIGVSSDNNYWEKYKHSKMPVIAAWNIKNGELRYPQDIYGKMEPPQNGDNIGFLIDFKTKWNGCIRIFKNKKELKLKNYYKNEPYIYDLATKGHIHGNIPPISLIIGAYYNAKFKFTIQQFPSIPVKYRCLFRPFYTEETKLNHIRNMLQNADNKYDRNDYDAIKLTLNSVLDALYKMRGYRGYDITIKEDWRSFDNFVIKVKPTSKNYICVNKTRIKRYNVCAWMWRVMRCMISSKSVYVIYSIIAIFVAGVYQQRMEEILLLYRNCQSKGKCEYQMALRTAKKLQGNRFREIKEDIIQKWNRMKCNNCNKSDRLKSCKGCLKVVYCSKMCQKYHWKRIHRYWCDKSWYHPFLYTILQTCLD